MKQQLTQDRKFVIHDFDGVHLEEALFNAIYGNIYRFYARAKIKAADILLPDHGMNYDQILIVGRQNYLETGDGFAFFRHIAESRGMDTQQVYEKAHKLCHALAYAQAMESHEDNIIPCPETINGFERMKGLVSHALLTMSCVETWAKPLMERKRILGYFEEHALIGARECNFENKASSTYPLAVALQRLKARPEESIFCEDNLANMRMAKALDQRILTVYVSQTATKNDIPDFVDIHVVNITQFLGMLADKHEPRPIYVPPQYSLAMR